MVDDEVDCLVDNVDQCVDEDVLVVVVIVGLRIYTMIPVKTRFIDLRSSNDHNGWIGGRTIG